MIVKSAQCRKEINGIYSAQQSLTAAINTALKIITAHKTVDKNSSNKTCVIRLAYSAINPFPTSLRSRSVYFLSQILFYFLPVSWRIRRELHEVDVM